jgi:hypothetical protein
VIAIVTGDVTDQVGHATPSQVTAVVGALESDSAVKPVAELERPAAFSAVTEPLCVAALLENV